MRFLIGFALFLMSNSIWAQISELKVDDSVMPGTQIDRVFINNTGGLEIQSVSGVEYEVREVGSSNEGSLINSFTLNGETNLVLQLGAEAEIVWTTHTAAGAECFASTATNDLDDWLTGTAKESEGGEPVTFPTAGDYVLLLNCFTADEEDTDAVSVTVEGASIIDFTVAPDSEIVHGQEVTLTFDWEAEYVESCSGDWPGAAATLEATGSQAVAVTLNSTTTYTLTCSGLNGESDSDVKTVEVIVPAPQQNCGVTLTGTEAMWGNVFVSDWPLPTYEKKRVPIPENGYLAVKFNTGSVVDTGVFSTLEAVATTGWRLGSVSTCKGEFDVDAECTYSWGDHGGIYWNTGEEPLEGYCNLEPGTDYYWNVTFTDGQNPTPSRCAGSACLTTLIPINND